MISFFTAVTSSNLENPKARITTTPVMPSGGADSESEVIQASEAGIADFEAGLGDVAFAGGGAGALARSDH
jgi:hypothetical protein